MYRGLYTSAMGMQVQMKALDIVANNIANVDTTGFKRDTAVTQSFPKEMMKRLHDDDSINSTLGIFERHDVSEGQVTLGVMLQNVHTYFEAGRYVHTEGTLNFALEGDGFFVINATDAEGNAVQRFTRDGSFITDEGGVLRTLEGNAVVGTTGEIVIPPGRDVVVRGDGAIYVDTQYVDTIQTTTFNNYESLRKVGNNLYMETDQSQRGVFAGNVIQGYLEGSNVSSVNEMVKMIAINRAYEANQRLVVNADNMLNRAVNDIGKR